MDLPESSSTSTQVFRLPVWVRTIGRVVAIIGGGLTLSGGYFFLFDPNADVFLFQEGRAHEPLIAGVIALGIGFLLLAYGQSRIEIDAQAIQRVRPFLGTLRLEWHRVREFRDSISGFELRGEANDPVVKVETEFEDFFGLRAEAKSRCRNLPPPPVYDPHGPPLVFKNRIILTIVWAGYALGCASPIAALLGRWDVAFFLIVVAAICFLDGQYHSLQIHCDELRLLNGLWTRRIPFADVAGVSLGLTELRQEGVPAGSFAMLSLSLRNGKTVALKFRFPQGYEFVMDVLQRNIDNAKRRVH